MQAPGFFTCFVERVNQMLDLNMPTFVFVIINLLVLYWILKRLLFKPVKQFMENRTDSIRKSIEKAEKDKAYAAELKNEYESKLRTAREQANEIIMDARSRADSEYNAIIKTAKQDAEAILSRAREEIELERERMLKDIRNEVASLALAAASRVLEENMDNETNRAIVDKFLDEAGVA